MATVNELADLYAGKTNPALYTTIRDSFNQQQLQQELINRQKQQTLDQGAQSFPLEQAIKQGQIDTSNARLPGITAESNIKQREDAFDASQFFNKLDEAQRTHLLKASQNDLDMMDATAAKMMQDPNPEVRKQGQALYSMSRGVQKAQMEWGIRERIAADKNASQERIAAARNAAQANIARMRNEASKKAPNDPRTYEALAASYRKQAMADPEHADLYNAEADKMDQLNAWLIAQRTVKPGAIDTGAATGLPTTAPPAHPNAGKNTGPKKDAQGRIILD